MEKLRTPSAGSVALRQGSDRRSPTTSGPTLATLPPAANRFTEVDIPRSVWSAWREDGKPHALRRPLTGEERAALEARRDELTPAVQPHGGRDVDRVALALTDMFGGFPSMRQRDDSGMVAKVDSVRRLLGAFPAWAIEKACGRIRANGVCRDGKFDRQWPPSDAEIIDAVRTAVDLYADPLRSAIALLVAPVEES